MSSPAMMLFNAKVCLRSCTQWCSRPAAARMFWNSFQIVGWEYLGTPVWWYGAPQSILTALQQADLSGKKIVFFGIHRGSGFAGIPEEILSYQPDAVIVDRFTMECQTPNEETRAEFSAFLDQIVW